MDLSFTFLIGIRLLLSTLLFKHYNGQYFRHLYLNKEKTGSDSIKEEVALNLRSPLSKSKPNSGQSNYMLAYCEEIHSTESADCMARVNLHLGLACYDDCGNKVRYYGAALESVEGYSREMLYLMVQILYLDRFMKTKKKEFHSVLFNSIHLKIDCYCQKKTLELNISI